MQQSTMVSITTKQNVRYEGTVYVVEKMRRSIYLKDVKCMGTEDRIGPIYIPPSNKIQPMVEFHNDQILLLVKQVKTDVDLNQHPGAPIPKEQYPQSPIKHNQRFYTEQLNRSVQEIQERTTPPYRREQYKKNARAQQLSQSPVGKNFAMKPAFITNNYLQQKTMEKYQKLFEIRQNRKMI